MKPAHTPDVLDALGQALPLPHARAAEPGPAGALGAALRESSPVPPALGARLLERVRGQRAANAPMLTRRRPLHQGQAEAWAEGVQAHPLHGGSWLLELAPGARLNGRGSGALELLVLAGSLDLEDGQALHACGHALLPPGTPLRAGSAGPLRLYWREHGAAGPFHAPAVPQLHTPQAWQPLRPGVEICPLHGEGAAVSLLARFAAGGRVPGHPHGLDEECLMVEGELFLDDLLLPEGGFQFAPAGSLHGDLFADAPCLLFFHGAIDPAAVDNEHRQTQGWPALG
ncbi:cupin domain-containing protein [Inhella sp.]|uniref:cupin domain-containing protein n=1 Tax=Inhella sp. TaxID=1921806 RepID=UPI0035B386EC